MAIAIAFITITFSIFAPGYLLTKCLGYDNVKSIAIAPPVSCCILLTLGVVLHILSINAGIISMLLIPTAALLVIYSLIKHRYDSSNNKADQLLILSLYVLIGILLVLLVLFKHQHGLDAFQPDNDNATHLAIIKNMASSKILSVLSTSAYFDTSVSPDINTAGVFYPSIFHLLAALSIFTSGVTVQAAENITAAVIIAMVYTSGCYALFRAIEPNNRNLTIAGAVGCLLIVGFPWRFIVWGPLYPNLLSLSLIPAALSVEIEICNTIKENKLELSQVLLFLLTIIAVCGSHPNGLFTLGVLSIGLLSDTLFSKVRATKKGKFIPVFATLGFLVCVIAIWTICFLLPAFQGVVNYKWPANQTLHKAVISLLFFGFTRDSRDPVLLILLCIGIVCIMRRKEFRWIVASYLLTAFMFIVAVSSDGVVKQYLCGFWYCDHNRIAACTSLAAMPLICIGLASLFSLLENKVSNWHSKKTIGTPIIKLSVSVLIILVVCFPFFVDNCLGYPTTFQDYTRLLDYKFDKKSPSVYSSDEVDFVEKADKLIKPETKVINIPFDGSCFAYDIQDLNIYYRDPHVSGAKSTSETEHSWLYRKQLSNYLNCQQIRDALKNDHIEYVLMLDDGDSKDEPERFFIGYNENDWSGITSINENTPGFSLVLAKDDMKLYKIDF